MQAISIYEPIRRRLDRVEHRLEQVTDPRFPFLARLLQQVFETVGKRARPAVTLLASTFHSHDEERTETMAAAVELLHVATLIHDDTVDDSDTRRGRATISNLWGRNVAVLVGDYVFAASATFVCDTGDIRVIRRFSETIMELSRGELCEIAEAYNPNQTREQYFSRICDKTASLFTTASESGAILSGASEATIQALSEYGSNLGMAFQIVDDIMDFNGTEAEVGKPVGNDLAHGIMTLPALIAVERYPQDNPIPALLRNPQDVGCLERAVVMVQEPSIIDDSHAVADAYGRKALDALAGLPMNPSRDALEELVGYVLTRRC